MRCLFFSLLLCVLLLVSQFEKSQSADSDAVASSSLRAKGVSLADYQKKVAAYWTAERRHAAKPMTLRTLSSQKNRTGRHPESVVSKDAAEKTVVINPQSPSSNANRSQLGFQPTRTAGKVYFTQYFIDYLCSASVVTSPSQSLVITAAHCVYDVDYKVWSTNWVFVPAYDVGDEPLGSWTASTLHTSKNYINAPNFDIAANYDVGFAVMLPLDGKKIAEVVGSNGIAFNYPRTGVSYAFGYPVYIGDGEIMSSCMGQLLSENCDDPAFLGQSRRCGMTGGSSGGPWLQKFNDKTGLGTVTSVTSFTCAGVTPYVLYGPPFNNQVRTLYNAVRSLTA